MPVISIRVEDELYRDLTTVATAEGISVSTLARRGLKLALQHEPAEAPETPSGLAPVPVSMTTIERQQLALLNRILAAVVGGGSEAGDFESLTERAVILEKGYTEQYEETFYSIEAELSRRDTEFVMDVMEMFERLEWSYDALSEAERIQVGEHAEHSIRFRGFDFNSRRESRLAGYARHLIAQDKWESLAKYFDRQHDRGNSHMPMARRYEAMLEEFTPIWRQKIRGPHLGGPESYQLSVVEIRRVIGKRDDEPEIWAAT